MEGEIKDKHEEESLKERIQHLEKINNEELETQNMLKSQISMLESESRLVTKNIMANNIEIQKLVSFALFLKSFD